MVADGGDSVDGDFLRQEWLMRRLALCQSAVALHVLRKGGDFFCKIFDTFTPFLHDLLYLLSQVFDKMAIVKPLTSRPANSERYIMCMGLREKHPPLADYLLHVNTFLDDDDESVRGRCNLQVKRLVDPTSVPAEWTDYVKRMNMRIGEAQVHALEETMRFYEDPILDISAKQQKLAKELIQRWGVPSTIEKSREILKRGTSHEHLAQDGSLMFTFDPIKDQPIRINRQTQGQGQGPQATLSAPQALGGTTGGGAATNAGHNHTGISAPGNQASSAVAAPPAPPKKLGPDLSKDPVLQELMKRAAMAEEKASKERQEKEQAKNKALAGKQVSAGADVKGKDLSSLFRPKKKASNGNAGGNDAKNQEVKVKMETPDAHSGGANRKDAAGKDGSASQKKREREDAGDSPEEGKQKKGLIKKRKTSNASASGEVVSHSVESKTSDT
jgi:hypothetical protein